MKRAAVLAATGFWALSVATLSAATPQRIVTLAPHLTELVYAAGAGARIVGTLDTSEAMTQRRSGERCSAVRTIDMEPRTKFGRQIGHWPERVDEAGVGGPEAAGVEVEGPVLVVEVLSPYPRIGRPDEKVRWYSSYGVREIWLYNQVTLQLDVLGCANGGIVRMRRFFHGQPIESGVLPGLDRLVGEMVGGRTEGLADA